MRVPTRIQLPDTGSGHITPGTLPLREDTAPDAVPPGPLTVGNAPRTARGHTKVAVQVPLRNPGAPDRKDAGLRMIPPLKGTGTGLLPLAPTPQPLPGGAAPPPPELVPGQGHHEVAPRIAGATTVLWRTPTIIIASPGTITTIIEIVPTIRPSLHPMDGRASHAANPGPRTLWRDLPLQTRTWHVSLMKLRLTCSRPGTKTAPGLTLPPLQLEPPRPQKLHCRTTQPPKRYLCLQRGGNPSPTHPHQPSRPCRVPAQTQSQSLRARRTLAETSSNPWNGGRTL